MALWPSSQTPEKTTPGRNSLTDQRPKIVYEVRSGWSSGAVFSLLKGCSILRMRVWLRRRGNPAVPRVTPSPGAWAGLRSTAPEWLLSDPTHWGSRTEAFRQRLQGQAGWGLSKEAGGPTACSGDFEAGLFSGGKECGCSHVSPFFRLLACGVGRGHPAHRKTVGQSPITPGASRCVCSKRHIAARVDQLR